MLEACIVIASLVGVLSTEPNNKLVLYKADCQTNDKFFILGSTPNTIKEVDIVKINSDTTYTIKLKG